MFKASADVIMPTSIIGSLPRPAWYTASLGNQSFLEAMVNSRYREQYEDAVSVFLRAQEVAGLDICTDGDAHYDEQVGGMSWQSYPLTRMAGFSPVPEPSVYRVGALAYPRGHILHDFLEARVFPRIVGPVGPGNLQYAALWKTAQKMTKRPVKFGTILPELLAASVEDDHYKDPVERCLGAQRCAQPGAQRLADAGCPVIQLEEPLIHMVPVRGKAFGKLGTDDLVKLFNNTVKGLRAKTEVWCHTCWGNPSQQRLFKDVQSYQPTLPALGATRCRRAHLRDLLVGPRRSESDGRDDQGQEGRDRRDRSSHLQVERPDDVAALIRQALAHIPAQRLVISSDCGMGREGMARRHASYKMVAMVLGTNIVRGELGLPQAECLAADPRYSLAVTAAN